MFRFSCSCGKVLEVGEAQRGRSVRCPDCGSVTQAPSEESTPVDMQMTATPMERTFSEKDPAHAILPSLPVAAARPSPNAPEVYSEIPPPGLLVNHAGVPIAEDDDFFAAAPTQIGRLLSGQTTLKVHNRPWAWPARLALFLPGLVGCLTMFAIYGYRRLLLTWMILSMLVAWMIFVIAVTRFSHMCNYVGTRGLAVFRCRGRRGRVARARVFLFQDAMNLRTGQTKIYVNGIYAGTRYFFTWSDKNGQKVHSLRGNYRSRTELPDAQDPFRYALAAETAWTEYLCENSDWNSLTQDEVLHFALAEEDWVRLGQGEIHLKIGDEETALANVQIEKVILSEGIISLFEVGGKEGWFTSMGVHKIVYKDLANARFFLFAFDKLMGFRLY